jgi:hypothetical protein
MTTFLIIVFVLVVLNAGLLIFSITNTGLKMSNLKKSISDQTVPKIYPLEFNTDSYKKAI